MKIIAILAFLCIVFTLLGLFYYKRESIRELFKTKLNNDSVVIENMEVTNSDPEMNKNTQKCPDCNCVATDAVLKSKDSELKYLRWMTRLLGVLLRKENALNRVMSEHSPGVFASVPFVEKVEQEVTYVQDLIQKDPDMLDYFQSNFTKYSGIDSKPYIDVL